MENKNIGVLETRPEIFLCELKTQQIAARSVIPPIPPSLQEVLSLQLMEEDRNVKASEGEVLR